MVVNQAKYNANGTGRDTYISDDNGGFKNVKKIKPLQLEYRSPKNKKLKGAYADLPWAPSIMSRGFMLDEPVRRRAVSTKQQRVSNFLSQPKNTFELTQYHKYSSPKVFTGYTNTSGTLPVLSPGGTTAQPFWSTFSPSSRPKATQWGSPTAKPQTSPTVSPTGLAQGSPWY